jgi:hypothetical protein
MISAMLAIWIIHEGAICGHRGLGPKSLRSFSANKRLSAKSEAWGPHEDLGFSGSVTPYRSRSAFASSVRPSASEELPGVLPMIA